MSVITDLTILPDDLLEIKEEALADGEHDYGVVTGYWKSDGHGHTQKVEPYFYLTQAASVKFVTKVYGSINATLNTFNITANHGGPSFTQTGGSASLGPGQWRLYFMGSISTMIKSGVEVTVKSNAIPVLTENDDEEAEVIEERDTIFKVRAIGSSRPQAIRIAYRRAEKRAGGKPFRVLEERVYAQANKWVCILSCELL